MVIPFPLGSLVAAYARDSGGDAQELSISQQLSAFRQFCQNNGLIPGAIFQDAARPGSSVVGRDGFQDMMHHFRHEAPEAGLVIWSYSRFARDIDDASFYRADLRRRGYILHSLNDSIPEGNIGRLFEAVIDWKNSTFLEDLSRDTRRGLHDLVKVYGAVPGTPPRGFARVPVTIGKRRDGKDRIAHRWVPDPEVVPRVVLAFQMRAAGRTLAEIHAATKLYGSFNSYQTFFTNRLYIGVLEFGDQLIEHYCEPIIDLETWTAVQAKIKQHAQHKNLTGPAHPRRINSSYLLSGLAYCARCNSPLFGAPSKQHIKPDGTRNADYERYACARSYRRHDCDQGQFPQAVLDNAVLATIQEYVLQPEVIQAHQAQAQATRADLLVRNREQRAITANSLAGVRRRIANLADAIAESGHTRALLEKLSALETEELNLRSQLAELDRQASQPDPDLTLGEIDHTLMAMREILDHGSHSARQQLLRGFVERITVDRDGNKILGSIAYYIPPPIDHPPPDSVPMSRNTLGAPLHRHRFTVSFSATMRTYNKKRS